MPVRVFLLASSEHRDTRLERRWIRDELDALIDWTSIAQALGGIYAAAKGEPAWADATVIRSASEADGDARLSGHRACKAIHGYKAVGADVDTARSKNSS